MGALLVTAIEYITSYVLEKLFDARYWDYSAYPLNINGRVSVISSVFFGFAVMFGVKILHPIMEELVVKIPDDICAITAISVLVIFITDAVFTSISMANLNKKFKAIYDYIDEYVDEKFETITDRSKFLDENLIIEKKKNLSVALHKISDLRNNVKHGMSVSAVANVRQNVKDTVLPNIKGLRERSSEVGISRIFKDNELHFLRAFPYFKSTKYNDLVERIKMIQRSKNKDK
jgi:uncharacterized membrane protein